MAHTYRPGLIKFGPFACPQIGKRMRTDVTLIVLALIAVVVVPAIHSSNPEKRKAAQKVLRIFLEMLRVMLHR